MDPVQGRRGGEVGPCPAVLLSTFLVFFTLWVVNSRQHAALYKAAVHWTSSSSSSAGSNSPVQFRLPIRLTWTDWGTVWVVYLLVFQAAFFSYYSFLTAKQWGFILSYLGECQSPSRTPTASDFSIFTSLSLSLVTEIFQTQTLQNSDFCLPSPSTQPPPPSQVGPWEICWWKHRLPIKKCLEEVSLSIWQMSVWWQ